jgi:hypothetical protein
MGETNSPSVAHVGYDISPLSRVKFKILTKYVSQHLPERRIICLESVSGPCHILMTIPRSIRNSKAWRLVLLV